MSCYKNSFLEFFFGNKKTAIDPSCIRGKRSSEFVVGEPFSTLQHSFEVSESGFVFLHQTHSIKGEVITHENMTIPAFTQEGDYLLTNIPKIGIGVVTADCLPLILVDPVKKAVGVVHAGWKGLVAGVVEQAVDRMQLEYGSVLTDISFIVGPSAHVCCYEVGRDFFDEACVLRPTAKKSLEAALFECEGKLFFDAILFFKSIFFEKGFLESCFDFSYAECTICKPIYCSYRREKMSPLRQLTIVSLK